MPNIRYVALSDLHLGEDESLLTHVDPKTGEVMPDVASPTLQTLASCLRELVKQNDAEAEKPTLILNGDILELASCASDQAIRTFARFVARLTPADDAVFGDIVYVPGNHDHHLWETARETQYLNYMSRLTRIEDLEPAWHTTKVFMDMQGKDRLVQDTLTAASRQVAGPDAREVLTAYPNYGILGSPGGRTRCVVFHHGHFTESVYHAMSTAASLLFSDHQIPEDVYELESENFAWIDFFWSTMGRSGKVGTEIGRIYEATGDVARLRRLMDTFATNLARRYEVFSWPGWLRERVLRWLFRSVAARVAGRQERQLTGDVQPSSLSEKARERLRWYLEGPLCGQVRTEHGPIPDDVTFVFGHTHKPFEGLIDWGVTSRPVKVINTGGWVVDTKAPRPVQGGAVALVDEDLNAVSLRFYNEGDYRVHVEEPLKPDGRHSALWDHVRSIPQADPDPWRAFTEAVAREAQLRMARFGR